MLIFDGFVSYQQAGRFADYVHRRFGSNSSICPDQDASDLIDPIPCKLIPPIVLVERDRSFADEGEIASSVARFGGRFAGT